MAPSIKREDEPDRPKPKTRFVPGMERTPTWTCSACAMERLWRCRPKCSNCGELPPKEIRDEQEQARRRAASAPLTAEGTAPPKAILKPRRKVAIGETEVVQIPERKRKVVSSETKTLRAKVVALEAELTEMKAKSTSPTSDMDVSEGEGAATDPVKEATRALKLAKKTLTRHQKAS